MSLKPLQIPVKIKMKQLGCTRFASWGTTGPLCLAIQPTAILEVRLARGPWPSQSLSVVILKKKQQPVPIFLFKNPNPTLTTYVFFELTMLSAEHLVRARKAQWLALRSQRYPYSTKGEPRSQSFPTTLKHWNIYLTHFASSELHGWPRPPAPAVFALRGLHLNLGSLSACPGVLGRGIFGSFLRI